MFQVIKEAGKVTVKSLETGQQICFKGAGILDLQREINLAFPVGESPVRQAVKMELLDIARNSGDTKARVEACQLLLDCFTEQPSNLLADEATTLETSMLDKGFAELQQVCTPVVEYLKRFHPHTTIIISNSEIKLEETQMFIPVK